MESELKAGIQGSSEMRVAEKDTAYVVGSGGVKVLSTPSMITTMEQAAQLSVKPLMKEGYLT